MKITRNTIFIAALLVILFVQAPHLAFEFKNMSNLGQIWEWIHGFLFAIAIDFCVLIFATRGHRWATSIFAVISFFITIQYYNEYIDFANNFLASVSTIMIAAAGVLAIFYLCEEARKIDAEDESVDKDAERQRIRKEIEKELNEPGLKFSNDELEIIKMRKEDVSYDSIIEHFKSKGSSISKDKISKTIKKFKSIYQDD